jgi:hypothetical protein
MAARHVFFEKCLPVIFYIYSPEARCHLVPTNAIKFLGGSNSQFFSTGHQLWWSSV